MKNNKGLVKPLELPCGFLAKRARCLQRGGPVGSMPSDAVSVHVRTLRTRASAHLVYENTRKTTRLARIATVARVRSRVALATGRRGDRSRALPSEL